MFILFIRINKLSIYCGLGFVLDFGRVDIWSFRVVGEIDLRMIII